MICGSILWPLCLGLVSLEWFSMLVGTDMEVVCYCSQNV